MLQIAGNWEAPFKDQWYTFTKDGKYSYRNAEGVQHSGTYFVASDYRGGHMLRMTASNGNFLFWGLKLRAGVMYLDAMNGLGYCPYHRF